MNVDQCNSAYRCCLIRSTAALGKRAFDMKVEYAVSQIRRLLEENKTTTAQ